MDGAEPQHKIVPAHLAYADSARGPAVATGYPRTLGKTASPHGTQCVLRAPVPVRVRLGEQASLRRRTQAASLRADSHAGSRIRSVASLRGRIISGLGVAAYHGCPTGVRKDPMAGSLAALPMKSMLPDNFELMQTLWMTARRKRCPQRIKHVWFRPHRRKFRRAAPTRRHEAGPDHRGTASLNPSAGCSSRSDCLISCPVARITLLKAVA